MEGFKLIITAWKTNAEVDRFLFLPRPAFEAAHPGVNS